MDQHNPFMAEFDTLSSGVYIVTSMYRNQLAGCTCVWLSRASFEPPQVAVALSPVRHTFQVIEQSGRLCVNVLGASGLALARSFGTASGHNVKKFADVGHTMSENNSPVLTQAVSYLDCKLTTVVPIGDHRLVIGEVVAAAVLSNEPPLVYDPAQFYEQQADRIEAIGGA